MGAKKRGLVMVYTGSGKGKTTAAVGQAVRAAGHGYRVYMLHFMKGRDYGEFLAAGRLTNLTIVRAGRDVFVNRDNPEPVDIELAREGFKQARQAIFSGEYDLVVLDEINVAVDYGLIAESDLLQLLADKPPGVDL
ncbi:MAG: cob(I)yrinic acid a,c-diamide adenosyltransferase, partial [Dethiobacter sp.]|nr:cob(I)yrinic acid a,c-diamide adenosyltransferase [Dethiobacter sp.]